MQTNEQKKDAPEEMPEQTEADAAPETEATPNKAADETPPAAAAGPSMTQDAPAEEAPASDALAAELAETKDRLLRALAEAENVRRRAQRDVEQASKRAIAGFAREMLTVADNLGRALGAVDGKTADADDTMKTLLTGVDMTARDMLNAFERNGIQRLDPVGQRFDPQQHEAMYEYEDASKPAGTVGQVIEAGYLLHGKPLRPAKVGVTKGGPQQAAQAAASGSQDPAGGGKTAYEDQGKKPGSQLDEEL